MSRDGKGELIPRTIKRNYETEAEHACPCGGTIMVYRNARYATCSNGEARCTWCFREARKFGRGGLTCGTGCRQN
jgi:hypothetical protein